jgi:uncharacterized membrane protein
MQRAALATRAAFALGMILVGAIGLAFPDFSAVWGPAPNWINVHTELAYGCAVVALAAGLGLLVPTTIRLAALLAFAYTALWWLLLKVPPVIKAPFTELPWLDCAMFGMLMAGAWILVLDCSDRTVPERDWAMRHVQRFVGLCLIPIGLSNFLYLDLTTLLIPQWLPFHLELAAITGACPLGVGLALVFGVLPRLAASFEAALLGVFTAVVWVPRVIAMPALGGNWIELWMYWTLTATLALLAVHSVPRRDARANEAAA